MQGQQEWVQDILDGLPKSIQSRADVPIDIKESPAKAVLDKIRELSDRILETGRADLTRFQKRLSGAVSQLASYRAEWNKAFEIAKEQYRVRLAELGATNLAQAAIEQRNVEQELTNIETSVEPAIALIESQVTSLTKHRATLLAQLRTARLSIIRSRSTFVEELNSKLGGNVMVDLSGVDTSLYFDAIDSRLHKSGMQHREDQVSLVCERFTANEFVEILRAGSINKLTSIGVTENNATRMIKVLTDGDLYEIERVDVPQLPNVRIKREGETVYTNLSSLSIGEKCSAILSIALLSKASPWL